MSGNACGHPGQSFRWVDESNAAITKSSHAYPLCRSCYTARYGTPREFRRPTEEDTYRETNGILGVHNLLSSGDFQHRHTARDRFTILAGRVVFTGDREPIRNSSTDPETKG